MEIVAVDIGGTHARFAIAAVKGGRVIRLDDPVTLKTSDYASLEAAWDAFAGSYSGAPRAAAIAVASPVDDSVIRLTNNSWTIQPATLADRLGVDQLMLLNDFGAVGHAVAQCGPEHLLHVSGPDASLPERGIITVCGPGTGLGVAQLLRTDIGYRVIATEGGHIDFAPLDVFEDRLLQTLRNTHTRVSVERVCSGPGIVAIHDVLAKGQTITHRDDKAIWTAALAGGDRLATTALDRFLLTLGSVAGDLALAQGAQGVVLAGGLGLRLKDHFAQSGFAERFVAKGRFRQRMAQLPVKLITHPQPGLFGAAAAFAQEHTA